DRKFKYVGLGIHVSPGSRAGDMTDLDILEGAEKSENLQQVDDHRDHNDGIQDTFDFAVHGNVVVYEPEEHSDNDQDTDDIEEGHEVVLLVIFRAATLSGQQKFHRSRHWQRGRNSRP